MVDSGLFLSPSSSYYPIYTSEPSLELGRLNWVSIPCYNSCFFGKYFLLS